MTRHMIRRLVFPVLLGLVGAGILAALGQWQVRRLHWKEALLARISSKIGAPPVAVPAHPDPARDQYLPVTATGRLAGPEIHVLTSPDEMGPGYRIIATLTTADGRRLMVDEGFVPASRIKGARPAADVTVTGNLKWPQESDYFTPKPEVKANIWFARDVPSMARALNAAPVLIVARRIEGFQGKVTPIPVDTRSIPNNHYQYAVTWFSLAVVWLGMTGLLVWRITREKE